MLLLNARVNPNSYEITTSYRTLHQVKARTEQNLNIYRHTFYSSQEKNVKKIHNLRSDLDSTLRTFLV